MTVVMMANLTSPIVSLRAAGCADGRSADRDGDELGLFLDDLPFGRHRRTASTDALHGCTWSGYENMTSITIAALAIVDATDGMSVSGQRSFVCATEDKTYTFPRYFQGHCCRMIGSL